MEGVLCPNLDQEGGQPAKGLGHRLGLILEALVVVWIALQIPIHSMSQSYHTVANRYELHRCRREQFFAASRFSRLWVCPAVLRGSSLLQDVSVV